MKGELKLTPIMEDYLKNIYYEIEEKGKCSVVELSKRMNLKPSSVSEMIEKLSQKGLVRHERYSDIELTETGKKIALAVIRHHRLIELYLLKSIGYDYEKLHSEAEYLEHHISDDLEKAIDDFLGNPKFDPHGHPIPDKEGNIPKLKGNLLFELEVNDEFIILQVPDNNKELLKFLFDNSFIPNNKGKIIEKNEIAGYVKVKLNDKNITLSIDVAKLIKAKKI